MNCGLRKRYDAIAKEWNEKPYDGLRRDDLLPKIMDVAELKPGERILEAMCGTGRVGEAAHKLLNGNCDLYYLDFSEEMLGQISIDSKKACGDVCDMPYKDNFFDRVFIRFGIHDIPETDQIYPFEEAYRILKPGGKFVLIAYHTTKETQKSYNYIVNLKDLLAGYSKSFNRHFPTIEEYLTLFALAGFKKAEIRFNFRSTLRYQDASELNSETSGKWKEEILCFPKELKKKMGIRIYEGNKVEYKFPGVVIVGEK